MSTYIYFECASHDPAIQAEDESGQHVEDKARAIELANRRAELTEEDFHYSAFPTVPEYFDRNSARFLLQHPRCHIRLVTEYGKLLAEWEAS